MKSEILFLKAGLLWSVFCWDDLILLPASTALSDFFQFLLPCFFPVFGIVFPFLYSSDEESTPCWARSLVLLLTVLLLILPFSFPLVELFTGKECKAGKELSLLCTWEIETGNVGLLIYIVVCIVLCVRLIKTTSDGKDENFIPLRINFSSAIFLAWCIGIPADFDFGLQMQLVYCLSGAYYVSSLVSRAPVRDLIFSCTGVLIFPASALAFWWTKTEGGYGNLFGTLFVDSESHISGILVLTLFPALFFLGKLMFPSERKDEI